MQSRLSTLLYMKPSVIACCHVSCSVMQLHSALSVVVSVLFLAPFHLVQQGLHFLNKNLSSFEGQSGGPQLGQMWRSVRLNSAWRVVWEERVYACLSAVVWGFQPRSCSMEEGLHLTLHRAILTSVSSQEAKALMEKCEGVLSPAGKTQEKLRVCLLRLTSGMGHNHILSSVPLQTSLQHVWHLDGLWAFFRCLLHDLISQRIHIGPNHTVLFKK